MSPGGFIQRIKTLTGDIEMANKVKIDFSFENLFCINSNSLKFVVAMKNGICKYFIVFEYLFGLGKIILIFKFQISKKNM